MKSFTFALAFTLAASSAAFADPTALRGAAYLPQAKITLAQARTIALRTEHGMIVDQELEKEQGGSGLRYSFDVKVRGLVHEVGVDARTGKVLEDSIDNGND